MIRSAAFVLAIPRTAHKGQTTPGKSRVEDDLVGIELVADRQSHGQHGSNVVLDGLPLTRVGPGRKAVVVVKSGSAGTHGLSPGDCFLYQVFVLGIIRLIVGTWSVETFTPAIIFATTTSIG